MGYDEQRDESPRRRRVQQLLDQGTLPVRSPRKLWAGPGLNRHCAGCGDVIEASATEYQLDYPEREILLCRQCYEAWEEERRLRS
jgi:hypothetical protein